MTPDYDDGPQGKITNHRWSSETAVDRWSSEDVGGEPEPEEHPLDRPEALEIHHRLIGHYYRELDRQAENRERMEADQDMIDHIHWTQEEIDELEDRGQTPLIFNVVATSYQWVLGTQRTAPMDYKILPRSADGLHHAERKTQLMKYVGDASHSQRVYSRAFANAVGVGVGWLESGQQEHEDGEPVYERFESWRNVLWDSTAVEDDLSDGRYLFRTKWVDMDAAIGRFPDRAELIRMSAESVYEHGYSIDNSGDPAMDAREEAHFDSPSAYVHGHYSQRQRVRIFEAWFRRVAQAQIVRGGDFSGELFDPWSEGHVESINRGDAEVVKKPREMVHYALFTNRGLIVHGPTPYRHNRFPLTPVWGHRRGRDGMPYGMVRGLRDIQRDLNKRASKMLYTLSSKRVLVEDGAVDDMEELRAEAARPDAVIRYKQGYQSPQVDTDGEVASAHADLMGRDIEMIQQVSGVTDESMGRTTNATSGKAIIARQQQGQLATSLYFVNLRYARMIHGEKVLALIEQFYNEKKKFRITNQRGNPEYVGINDPESDEDDWITRSKADFIISEEDWRATMRQQQVESLFEVLQQLAGTAPELVVSCLDLFVEAMDIPKRDELVKRIRQKTGTVDPDADPENPDPETQEIMTAKEEQAAMQKRAAEAEVGEKEAKAKEAIAKARKTLADAASAERGLQSTEISDLQSALSAAETVLGNQGIGRVADAILLAAQEAVAESEDGDASMAPVAAPPAQPAPQQQQMQPPAQPPGRNLDPTS